MNEKIRIGILGYGNLGRGVELALRQNPDMELVAFFTRRDPAALKTLTPSVPVYHVDDVLDHQNDIDVLILCGGSATDLPVQTPKYVRYFNVVDSFDNHAHIPEHFANVDAAAKESGKIGMISTGWDPGLFSMQRLLGMCALPQGSSYTFWGRGVSQGHSDAIRRVEGVQTVSISLIQDKQREPALCGAANQHTVSTRFVFRLFAQDFSLSFHGILCISSPFSRFPILLRGNHVSCAGRKDLF